MFHLNEYIWLGMFVVFLVVEAACPIHLVSTWFAAGSLVALLVTLLGAPVWLQLLLFILVSTGLLIGFWPLVKKFLNPKVTPTNVDSVIGSQGYVTQDIDNLLPSGIVKLGSLEWTARSVGAAPIPKGTLVKVVRIEGVKAFVEPVEN